MCGIAGMLNRGGAPASAAILGRMIRALAHRGPDGEEVMTDGALGLAHRRLAIIDLSPGGRQPMSTSDGRFTVSYNGEIYNFRELRAELEAKGRLHLAQRHRGSAQRLGAMGEGGARPVERHVRVCAVGSPAPRTGAGARPLRHQAAVLRRTRRNAAVRLGGQGAPRPSRAGGRDGPRKRSSNT